MELTKNHIAVAKFASASTIREELASVLIKDGKVVATDSFRLVELPIECDADAIPVLVNAKAFSQMKGKNIEATLVEGKPASENFLMQSEAMTLLAPTLDAGRFPDYETIFPTADPEASIRINGRYLAEVLSLLSKTEPFETVQIDLHGQSKPVVITTKAGRGLVMPVVAR